MRICRRGFLLVLSSPSGAGKTTIARRLIAADPGLTLSVSVTTRPPRQGEIDGRDYFFIDRERFDEMMARDEFLEHAIVFGNSYGTPCGPIEEALAGGRDIVGHVDWQGEVPGQTHCRPEPHRQGLAARRQHEDRERDPSGIPS